MWERFYVDWFVARIREYVRRAALRESGREWVDYSSISRWSVKPRKAGPGYVVDSQREQVSESTKRLRMQAEGSRWKWQDGRSGSNLQNTAYCSKRKASDESTASKEGKMPKKKIPTRDAKCLECICQRRRVAG